MSGMCGSYKTKHLRENAREVMRDKLKGNIRVKILKGQ